MKNPFEEQVVAQKSIVDSRDWFITHDRYSCYTKEQAEYARDAINNREALEAERDTYKPYHDALRARHNGYDEGTDFPEPESPAAALDELLCEADELTLDAPVHKVLLKLKERNVKLVAAIRTAKEVLAHSGNTVLAEALAALIAEEKV